MAPTSSTDPCAGVTQVKKKMFDFLKRGRLIRRGLASRKMRRRGTQRTKAQFGILALHQVVVFAVFAGASRFSSLAANSQNRPRILSLRFLS